MISGDLLRYNLDNKKFVVLDSETNGLNLFYTKPFNIGIQVYQNKNLIENHNLYIKWENYNINKELAVKVHYDKYKIDKEGKNPKEVLDILLNYLTNEEYYYIGNNILGYDCMIFNSYAKHFNIDIGYKWLNRLYDNNPLFKAYKLNAKPNYDDFLSWQFSLSNLIQKGLKSNVGYACNEFGIEYDKDAAHSAIYDCDKSYKIFLELVKKMDIK